MTILTVAPQLQSIILVKIKYFLNFVFFYFFEEAVYYSSP